MKRVIYPGTFDPISYGHINLVKRVLRLSDSVIIGISTNNHRDTLFSQKERLEIIKEIFFEYPQINVVLFDGLLINFCNTIGVDTIVRGLRTVSDFEYESQMTSINYQLNKKIETIFLASDKKYSYLSSTMIREIAKIDPSQVAPFVSPVVLKGLKKKYQLIK